MMVIKNCVRTRLDVGVFREWMKDEGRRIREVRFATMGR